MWRWCSCGVGVHVALVFMWRWRSCGVGWCSCEVGVHVTLMHPRGCTIPTSKQLPLLQPSFKVLRWCYKITRQNIPPPSILCSASTSIRKYGSYAPPLCPLSWPFLQVIVGAMFRVWQTLLSLWGSSGVECYQISRGYGQPPVEACNGDSLCGGCALC